MRLSVLATVAIMALPAAAIAQSNNDSTQQAQNAQNDPAPGQAVREFVQTPGNPQGQGRGDAISTGAKTGKLDQINDKCDPASIPGGAGEVCEIIE